ncbi:serine/threonine protein kinase [Massilia sp. PAMC28688]|uniref:serine/threonine-protein kinase n=1 Tax=Massilia sp. PAMC28688 TaxID=2861283 RepID=UPI001C633B27|nr:serine/threonine-protein kinase [Massilia sp. PAMC28688]QYF95742.1 serine/threonine protein kinase [Massilia sp. PAMC28688]
MIEQLGKYRVDSILGKGAMGVVYKAFDPGIERVVALKTIRKEMFSESEQHDLIGRFKNEAQAAGRLNHPNIVMVYDYGETSESAYIAMEFVEGAALDKLMVPERPTALPRVLAWMGDLLQGLQYAHSRGVVHRDVKPANLLITAAAQVKISDFGIARMESSTLTQAGSMIGTPSYMSPEQFRGDPVDGRSDVFSAGIVLYQLLTGVRPFTGSASAVMHQILNDQPPPPSQVLAALGRHFDPVVARAIAKSPAARFASAGEFHEALMAAARAAAGQHGADDPDATTLADSDRTILAAGLPALERAAPAQGGAEATGSGFANMTAWKREALPEVELLLARQIGPMARFLLKKVADKAEGLDQLADLLLPHIPSDLGRVQFQQAVAVVGKKLDATGTGTGLRTNATLSGSRSSGALGTTSATGTHAAGRSAISVPVGFDQAYADALATRLTLVIGPIARVVAKRAMKQTNDRLAFVQLLAGHIDNPAERARFIADAGAA